MAAVAGRLYGVVPPVVTPLTSEERLDEDGLRRLLVYLLKGGVHGLYLLGTTGEFPCLTEEVKVRAVEIAREEVGKELPILAGAGETSTVRSIRLAQLLEEAGADVIFATPPFYFDYTQEEIKDFYQELAAAVTIPVFLYNIPQLTRVGLEPATVRQLAADPRIVGIKDSSGDFAAYLEHIETARRNPGFRTFIGSETLAAASLVMGGHGIIASTANIWPHLWVELYTAAANGDVERAAVLQRTLRQAAGRLTAFGFAAGCKAALEIMGLTTRQVARPQRPVDDAALAAVRGILAEMGLTA